MLKLKKEIIYNKFWQFIFWWVRKDFYLFILFAFCIMGGVIGFYYWSMQKINNQPIDFAPKLQINPKEYQRFIENFQAREQEFLKAQNAQINEIFLIEKLDLSKGE